MCSIIHGSWKQRKGLMMKIKPESYMYEMIRTELADVVGPDQVDVKFADKFGHSIDYYWIPEMWHDRGKECPRPDFVVHPSSMEEVSRIMKIANQYRIPVVPWGGGSGSQGGALPVYNGATHQYNYLVSLRA